MHRSEYSRLKSEFVGLDIRHWTYCTRRPPFGSLRASVAYRKGTVEVHEPAPEMRLLGPMQTTCAPPTLLIAFGLALSTLVWRLMMALALFAFTANAVPPVPLNRI